MATGKGGYLKNLKRKIAARAKKRKSNPAPIPVGKWVKATKVKLNRDGTVNAMVPGTSLKKNVRSKAKKRKATTKRRKR